MNITKKLLTPNKYSRPQKPLKPIKGVVIHYIGVNGQVPDTVRNWWESLKDGRHGYASCHYIVGHTGDIMQVLPESEMAYHVGADHYTKEAYNRLSSYPNNCTIGIEMCHYAEGFTDDTLNASAHLAKALLDKYGLDSNDLYRHYDITNKLCPKFFVEDEVQWQMFKQRVDNL